MKRKLSQLEIKSLSFKCLICQEMLAPIEVSKYDGSRTFKCNCQKNIFTKFKIKFGKNRIMHNDLYFRCSHLGHLYNAVWYLEPKYRFDLHCQGDIGQYVRYNIVDLEQYDIIADAYIDDLDLTQIYKKSKQIVSMLNFK